MNLPGKIAIIGSGNIGTAIYKGILRSGKYRESDFTLTRRRLDKLEELGKQGAKISSDNLEAAKMADLIILTVLPKQLFTILEEIAPALDSSKMIVSVVTAYS